MKFSKMTSQQLFDTFERKIYDAASREDPFSNQEPTTISSYEVIIGEKTMYYAGINGHLNCLCFNATVKELLTSDKYYAVYPYDTNYQGVLVQLIKAPLVRFEA